MNDYFSELTGCLPFAWQEDLFELLRGGTIPSCCDLPTGLGKTSVMAIWLFALADRSANPTSKLTLPRRLVYVVDRRAVVDQATTEALKLKEFVDRTPELRNALGLSSPLSVSTLRGQFLDNRDWLADPAAPAVIVGTVDMIGSRLLFEGYGVSRKMRPLQAGLLGCDTLLVLDEAHLVPPFEALLKSIELPYGELFPSSDELRRLVPSFKLLSLSATSRSEGKPFGLTPKDLRPGTITHERLTARKRLTFEPLAEGENLSEALARKAWELTAGGKEVRKIIVFCNSREAAREADNALVALAKGNRKGGIPETKISRQFLVGARRVRERGEVASWLENHSFLGGSARTPDQPTFVFATAAGEVGVDLDADHLVCDLVAWERMVQRLGRVNRRGKGDAKVIVITEPLPKPTKPVEAALQKPAAQRDDKETKIVSAYEAKLATARAQAAPFNLLPKDANGVDVSPAALRDLRLSSQAAPENELGLDASERQRRREILTAATSPEPLRPALTRALVDAWSMTSLREHTGRPRIQPWLRGWVVEEPQTTVVWRTFLPVVPGQTSSPTALETQIEAFFEAAPPHLSEGLETETALALAWLLRRVEILAAVKQLETQEKLFPADWFCALILEQDGELRRALRVKDLLLPANDKKAVERREKWLEALLTDATLVLDAKVAGLSPTGLLDTAVDEPPPTLDGAPEWLPPAPDSIRPAIRFRVRPLAAAAAVEAAPRDPNWLPRLRLPYERSAEGEPQSRLLVEKWRGEPDTADDATAPAEQSLEFHQCLAAEKATLLATRLGLPKPYAEMLTVVARLHDEGKRRERWQNAFNAPLLGRPYAKTKGPINQALLAGYRHEFASLAVAAEDPAFLDLPFDLQDLGLHLIAAHHGFARPVIGTCGDPETPPSALKGRARETANRFSRLQAQWGPWGLAWWESLLRAADQQASSETNPAALKA